MLCLGDAHSYIVNSCLRHICKAGSPQNVIIYQSVGSFTIILSWLICTFLWLLHDKYVVNIYTSKSIALKSLGTCLPIYKCNLLLTICKYYCQLIENFRVAFLMNAVMRFAFLLSDCILIFVQFPWLSQISWLWDLRPHARSAVQLSLPVTSAVKVGVSTAAPLFFLHTCGQSPKEMSGRFLRLFVTL